MVNPRRASNETSLFDLAGAESVIAGIIEGFCSFVAVLNYKEKQNKKSHPHEKSIPISSCSHLYPIMQSDESI
jgi:hypothetical protein